jgi:hypothetical protein
VFPYLLHVRCICPVFCVSMSAARSFNRFLNETGNVCTQDERVRRRPRARGRRGPRRISRDAPVRSAGCLCCVMFCFAVLQCCVMFRLVALQRLSVPDLYTRAPAGWANCQILQVSMVKSSNGLSTRDPSPARLLAPIRRSGKVVRDVKSDKISFYFPASVSKSALAAVADTKVQEKGTTVGGCLSNVYF